MSPINFAYVSGSRLSVMILFMLSGFLSPHTPLSLFLHARARVGVYARILHTRIRGRVHAGLGGNNAVYRSFFATHLYLYNKANLLRMG